MDEEVRADKNMTAVTTEPPTETIAKEATEGKEDLIVPERTTKGMSITIRIPIMITI